MGTGYRGVAAATRDGRRIATGSDWHSNQQVQPPLARLWNAVDGQLETSFFVAERAPNLAANAAARDLEWPEATSIAFAPDNRLLFIGDQFGGCYLFSVDEALPRQPFYRHSGKISASMFLEDGRLVTAGSDGQLVVWRVAGNRTERIDSLDKPGSIIAMDDSLSAKGPYLILARGFDNRPATLEIVDVATLQTTRPFPLPTPRGLEGSQPVVRAVALHPSERRALVTMGVKGESDYFVGEWKWDTADAGSFRFLPRTDVRDVSMAVYAPNSQDEVLTVGGRGARLMKFATTRERPEKAFRPAAYRPQSGVISVSFSQDGQSLACAGVDGSVKIWKLEQQRWAPDTTVEPAGESVISVCFHPEQKDTLLTAGGKGTKLWQRNPQQWMSAVVSNSPARQAIFVPSGGKFHPLTVSDTVAQLWNGAKNPKFQKRPGDNRTLSCAACTPCDGALIAVGCGDQVFVLDPTSMTSLVSPFEGHNADVRSVVFSRDGRRLFSASSDFTIKVWDTSQLLAEEPNLPIDEAAPPKKPGESENKLMLTLEGGEFGHRAAVTGLGFSPRKTDPYLVSVGADGQAIRWPCEPYGSGSPCDK
jgi:WD40 repeat protein